MNREDMILNEIRQQAVIRADLSYREMKLRQNIHDTLDALQELTGLPRRELETIAANVRAGGQPEGKDFFSVKKQLLMVVSGLALISFLAWALIRFAI